jgi:hypothetical protein
MINDESSFHCFNCSKELPFSERARIPLILVAAASFTFLVLAQSFRWPKNVCQSCSGQVYLFACLAFLFALVVSYVVVLM